MNCKAGQGCLPSPVPRPVGTRARRSAASNGRGMKAAFGALIPVGSVVMDAVPACHRLKSRYAETC